MHFQYRLNYKILQNGKYKSECKQKNLKIVIFSKSVSRMHESPICKTYLKGQQNPWIKLLSILLRWKNQYLFHYSLNYLNILTIYLHIMLKLVILLHNFCVQGHFECVKSILWLLQIRKYWNTLVLWTKHQICIKDLFASLFKIEKINKQ